MNDTTNGMEAYTLKHRPQLAFKKTSMRLSLMDGMDNSDVDSDEPFLRRSIRRRHSGIPPKKWKNKESSNIKEILSISPPSKHNPLNVRHSSGVPSKLQRPPSPMALHPKKVSDIPSPNAKPHSKTPISVDYLSTPTNSEELLRIGQYSVVMGPVIGTGGFSTVYSVTDSVSRKNYALKVVQVSCNAQAELRSNLLEEVMILESLTNVDHVIQLLAHSAVSSQDQIYMLMELGQGDLRQILRSSSETLKPLEIDFVRYWGGQVLKAVAAVHSCNIVHADLKPANFIVVNGALKLCDFGIANPVPENTVSIRRNNAIGTLLYMAPETLQQSSIDSVYKVTKASDMWSCGIILYEMVYQSYPFNDRTYLSKAENSELEEIQHPKITPANSPVPLALHEVIRDCLNLVPSQRVTSIQAATSVFFAPVSVDLQAVTSITKNAYKYGHQFGLQNQQAPHERLEELASVLYQRLIKFNSGEA